MAKAVSFRRIKNSDPVKFKVLVEDLPRPSWLNRLSAVQFSILVALGSLGTALAVNVVGDARHVGQIKSALLATSRFLSDRFAPSKSIEEIRPREIVTLRRGKSQAKRTAMRSGGCDPNYSGCVPIASDVDCIGGMGDGPSFTGRVDVIGYDVYGLDGDGDGIGCE